MALRVASETPDDAEAIAEILAAGGRRKDLKIAAAWLRSQSYTWEHRNHLRAARLLKAAADGRLPTAPTAEQEALFAAVEHLESLDSAEAMALLCSEIPALKKFERQVEEWRSAPGWTDRDADSRVHEIISTLEKVVGPLAPEGSQLALSRAAFGAAHGYLLELTGLLLADDEEDTVIIDSD